MRLPSCAVLAVVTFVTSSGVAHATARGETFTCYFGHYGKVVIDTRDPGGSITVAGKRYPAQSGSGFYQSNDGSVAVLFGPRMKFWIYRDVSDHHCSRRVNAPPKAT